MELGGWPRNFDISVILFQSGGEKQIMLTNFIIIVNKKKVSRERSINNKVGVEYMSEHKGTRIHGHPCGYIPAKGHPQSSFSVTSGTLSFRFLTQALGRVSRMNTYSIHGLLYKWTELLYLTCPHEADLLILIMSQKLRKYL